MSRLLSTLIKENKLFRNKLSRAETWPDATSMVEDFVEECGREAVKVLCPKVSPVEQAQVIADFLAKLSPRQEPIIDVRAARVLVALAFDPALRSTLEASILDQFYRHLAPAGSDLQSRLDIAISENFT